MKLCKYCKKYYPESKFGVALTTKKKVYRRHKCKYCYSATKKLLRDKYHRWLDDYKKGCGCSGCDTKDPRVLEFHHLRDKEFHIALYSYNHYSFKRIKNEIKKCTVLCTNCHRILHHKERLEKSKIKPRPCNTSSKMLSCNK